MDQYICNKCYCMQDKIKYPLELTRCGHIFCHDCLKQVKNKCPECKSTEIRSIALTELPQSSKLLIPLSDGLTSIKSLITFQNEQKRIILECFYQIDYEYRILKHRYVNAIQNEKKIISEYYDLKKCAENLRKKLMFMKMNSITR